MISNKDLFEKIDQSILNEQESKEVHSNMNLGHYNMNIHNLEDRRKPFNKPIGGLNII